MQRSDASEKFVSGTVQVKYFDEKEIIEYDIEHFLANAHPASYHIIDVTANASSSVQQEQSKFVSQERGDILPLQRRHVSQPIGWKKNQRVFYLTWGSSLQSSGVHDIPKCRINKCDLDCGKITQSVMNYARTIHKSVAERGVNQQCS